MFFIYLVPAPCFDDGFDWHFVALLCFSLHCFEMVFPLRCFAWHLLGGQYRIASLCIALLGFVLLCFVLLCFALHCFALLCFALHCIATAVKIDESLGALTNYLGQVGWQPAFQKCKHLGYLWVG